MLRPHNHSRLCSAIQKASLSRIHFARLSPNARFPAPADHGQALRAMAAGCSFLPA